MIGEKCVTRTVLVCFENRKADYKFPINNCTSQPQMNYRGVWVKYLYHQGFDSLYIDRKSKHGNFL